MMNTGKKVISFDLPALYIVMYSMFAIGFAVAFILIKVGVL